MRTEGVDGCERGRYEGNETRTRTRPKTAGRGQWAVGSGQWIVGGGRGGFHRVSSTGGGGGEWW